MSDTIAAIATAHGIGAIAIIRISGKEALLIAQKLTKKENFKPRYAHLCDVYSQSQEIIDQSIILYFQAPHSFTTEDVVEIQSHGGSVVASMILKEILLLGARVAHAGEFTKRAYIGGRIDLSEAEAISGLIVAKSEDAVKILAHQMKGGLKDFVYEVREALLEVLAFVEVNIDYAEEDLPKDIEEQIFSKLNSLIHMLQSCYKASLSREHLFDGYKVAIIGKPNVGKSSLLNKMLNYERAIISEIAGTTRDFIEENITIGSHIIKIVDTAGIRHTEESIEKIGIERSKDWAKQADIVIALFDGTKPFEHEDEQILEILQCHNKETLVLINKSDLPQQFDSSKLEQYKPIAFSCKQHSNILYDRLKAILDSKSTYGDTLLTSTRQIQAVKLANESLQEALFPLQNGELEIFALEINRAIMFISSISQSFENDEVLDKMFGSFCLGK